MALFSRKKTPAVIDLREPVDAQPQWGSPVRCPACNGRGFLDHIDPYKGVMFLHCIECANKYEVTKGDLGADAAADVVTP